MNTDLESGFPLHQTESDNAVARHLLSVNVLEADVQDLTSKPCFCGCP